MQTNRRNWLKLMGMGVAGLGFGKMEGLAAPLKHFPGLTPLDGSPIKLNSNENPYGPSPMAKDAMIKNTGISNRYTWSLRQDLVKALATKYELTEDNFLLGAGSTEMLDLLARWAVAEKGSIVCAEPGFNYWIDTAEKQGIKKIGVPLTADKKVDLPALLQAIQADTRLVYLCNPNNPTGTCLEKAELEIFIKQASQKCLVVIDEAYLEYAGKPSVSQLVKTNKNLVVLKTYSKIHGLAGARIGYAIGHGTMIDTLASLQSWANASVSVASAAAAIASLQDDKFIASCHALNEKVRNYTVQEMESLKISCIPSATNFLYFSLSNYKKDFFRQLETHNIIGTRIYEENGQWSRITIGTMAEMHLFIAAIK